MVLKPEKRFYFNLRGRKIFEEFFFGFARSLLIKARRLSHRLPILVKNNS